MRAFIPLIIFLVSIATLFGQSTLASRDRFMTFVQNQEWLSTVKLSDKAGRWNEIKQRFFMTDNWNENHDSIQYSPLIVIDGVPLSIPDSLTGKASREILELLNENSITEITIVDKQPDNWIWHKPFSGAVLVSVDKKTSKRLFKLKFE